MRPILPEDVAEAAMAISHQHSMLRFCEKWLANNAKAMFELGLSHGRTMSKPANSEDVMYVYLNAPRRYDWKKLHRLKIRQVYGAGFDVGAMHKRLGA